ncbi:MAG: twin-arginine translocation signal domain-containing protein, partial [Acidobacteria bacterium]
MLFGPYFSPVCGEGRGSSRLCEIHKVQGARMAPADDFSYSRRDFLKTVGVGGLATGVIGSEAEAQTGLPRGALGPGEVPITLT